MKILNIFALPSHLRKDRTGGVDFFRVIQPMKHLDGFEYKGYKFKINLFDNPDDHKSLFEAVKENDIVFFNYLTNAWGFAAMGACARKFNKPLIMDVDDALWNIVEDNPVYNAYKKGSEGIFNFTAICDEVDYMTTTSNYLKNVITHNTRKKHDKIKVFGNSVDLDDIYTHRSKFKDDGQIRLLHHGSTTHFKDLQNAEFTRGIDKIMKEYPNVVLKTVGAMIPEYKNKWGQRYEHGFGDVDYYKWAKEAIIPYMDEADIMVIPLHDSIYTRCKSDIKFSESSAFVKPGVWQDIRQYSETVIDGENGFLAKRAKDWYKAIKKLIDDPKLRKSMGKKAYKTVVDEKQAKDYRDEWAEFFLETLDKA